MSILKQIVVSALIFVVIPASVFGQSAPGAPSGVVGVAGNGQATVTWIAAPDSGSAITGYTATSVQDTTKHCTTTGSLTCTVTGLSNGTAYSFAVTATNAIGTSVASSASSMVTPQAPPGAPTGVTAIAGNARATVSWTASPDSVAGYTATAVQDSGKHCTTTGALTCVVTGLSGGVSYTFTVTATNSAGTSVASSPSVAITPTSVPGVPTGVVGTTGNAQVAVTATAPVSNGGSAIVGYTVTASPGGATCTNIVPSCTVTGLTNGTSYTFTVTATNSIGPSLASAPSSAVIVGFVPGAPTGVSGVRGSGQVTVSWTAPVSNGAAITGYKVTAVQDSGKHCATTGAVTCIVTGLSDTIAYSFTVTASNVSGQGPASAASGLVTSIVSFSKDLDLRLSASSMNLQLPEFSGAAQVSIFDMGGRTVWNKTVGAGTREISWAQSSGRSIVPGIYILRLVLQDMDHQSRLAVESKIMLTP